MEKPEIRIAQRAAPREGVVGNATLRQLGLTYDQIERRVTGGQLHRRFNGVYAVGHPHLSPRGRLIAALDAGGPAAFLSGATATSLRGIKRFDGSPIEVTIPVGHTPKSRAGVIFHRTRDPIDAAEVTICRGLPTATVPRVLIEYSRRASVQQIGELLADAVQVDVFDPFALEILVQRHCRRPGVGKLKLAADYYRPLGDRKSELERMFEREHARRPEIPPCERNVIVDGWEIDCLWRGHGVALELDGRRFHIARRDFDKDRRKDTALQLMRLSPMRASYWMWMDDKETVIADLLALLALGAQRMQAAR